MTPREAILEFRETFQERFGSGRPADLDQVLGLARARHRAAALLLAMDPGALENLLDSLVWRSDLSEEALADVRRHVGLPTSGCPVNLWERTDRREFCGTLGPLDPQRRGFGNA